MHWLDEVEDPTDEQVEDEEFVGRRQSILNGLRPGFEPRDESWKRDAICSQIGDTIFYPRNFISAVAPKRVCDAMCSVREACLEYAMAIEEHDPDNRHGVWGGLRASERQALHHKRLRERASEVAEAC